MKLNARPRRSVRNLSGRLRKMNSRGKRAGHLLLAFRSSSSEQGLVHRSVVPVLASKQGQ